MRGPGYKLSLDVRRHWRCPACGYERRAEGRLTALRCRCASGPFMQLVSEPRFARKQNRPLDPYVSADEVLGPEDPPAPAPPLPDVTGTSESTSAVAIETSERFGDGLSNEAATPPPNADITTGAIETDRVEADLSIATDGSDAAGAESAFEQTESTPVTETQDRGPRLEGGGRNRRRRRGRGPRGPNNAGT